MGGVWGLREGARRPLAVSNARLRVNSVLNAVTRRGTFIGNSAGVLGQSPSPIRPTFCPYLTYPLALVYNSVNSTIDYARGEHDTVGSMAAGAVTGALYKCTGEPSLKVSAYSKAHKYLAGVRPALAAATLVSSFAGLWSYVKRSV